MSGVVFVGLIVTIIAMVNSAVMALSPYSPILLDPITGSRVHLFRWAEWAPLTFASTFLVEACDVPDPK